MKKLFTQIIPAIVIVLLPSVVKAQNVNIPDANFKAVLLADGAINTTPDTNITYAEAAAFIGSIDASSQSISDLTGIEAFTSATGLDAGFNNLTSLDLTYNVSLTFVDVTSNSLSTLNVAHLTSLSTLYCSINNLTCLDLHTNTGITILNCGSNNLTSLNLKNGNNGIITSMNAVNGGGMLYCIQVDNPTMSGSSPNWNESPWSSYNTTCGGAPIASFTSNAPQCMGTAVSFTNTSIASDYWIWDFGDGNGSALQNPSHVYANPGYYQVLLTAGNCNATDTQTVYTHQGMTIYGSATYTGGAVTSGSVVLANYVPFYTSFDTVLTTTLDPSGFFYFNAIADGDYLIKVFPDATFPTLVSTYYYNDWVWDSAQVLTHSCYIDDFAPIAMFELTPSAPGPGVLHGIVQQGYGYGRANGDPVHGVDVKLGITASNQIIATTTTDLLGEYTFANLAYGNYSIMIDIPGLERDSVYEVVLSAGTDSLMDLNYLVDSVAIYVLPNIGIEEVYEEDPNFKVYPNPVTESSIINYAIYSNAKVQLDVYNVFGMKVMSLVNAEQTAGNYQLNFNSKSSKLRPGVYLLSLSGDGKTKTKRIVITE